VHDAEERTWEENGKEFSKDRTGGEVWMRKSSPKLKCHQK